MATSETRKVLPSGAEVVVQVAPWEDAHRLYKAVMGVLEGVNMESDVVKLLSRLSTSEQVEAAVWTCMGRATYKNAKITKQTFEEEAAREDYLPVVKEVMVMNLRPFFKSLASMLPSLAALGSIVTPK